MGDSRSCFDFISALPIRRGIGKATQFLFDGSITRMEAS
jgi:hypothetical protein